MRHRLAFVGAAAFLGALLAWLATTPAALVHVNWDAGAYLHGIAAGKLGWSDPPWNAHFALQHTYLAGVWAARTLGGTPMDGFRLVNTFCFGMCTGLVADAALHLTRSRVLAGLLAALWATAFVTVFLLFTIEDNIVFLTPGIGVLWLCATRLERWSWIESAGAGLLCAGAALLSIQGVLYLAPPLCLTLFLRPVTVSPVRRALEAALVAAAFVAGLLAFVALIAATSRLGFEQLLGVLTSRPEPSHFPKTRTEIQTLLFDWRGSLRTLGLAVSFQLFQNRVAFDRPAQLITIGSVALVVEIGVWLMATIAVWRRREGAAAYLLSATLLLFSLLTALYRDVEYAYLKRTDFLPLLLTLVAAGAIGPRFATDRPRRALLAAALGLLVAWQAYSGLRWRHAEVAAYETLDQTVLRRRLPGYHGTSSGSYFRLFRGVRQQHPRACRYLFDASEVVHGRWNPDITGLLWSELPDHLVVGSAAEMGGWRRPVSTIDPGNVKLTGCEWVSAAARKRIGGR